MHDLPYAPPPPWYCRRLTHRSLNVAVLLLAGTSLYYLVPWSYTHLRAAYWLSRCESFSLPSTAVVYETDPSQVRSLAANPLYSVLIVGFTPTSTAGAAFSPSCWHSFREVVFNRDTMYFTRPILFCHERISSSGNRRIVVLQYNGDFDPPQDGDAYCRFSLELSALLIEPSWTAPPHCSKADIPFGPSSRPSPRPITRIYAAQPDPTDPSRLSFDYETLTSRHTAHLQLSPNGNSLVLIP